MQIALDGSDLSAERTEGPSVYAGELLPRLSRVLADRGHRVVTYAPGTLCGVAVAGELNVIPGSPFWTQRVLAAALRRDTPDALFLPIQMLPLFRPRRMATVAVVHDLEFLHYPETYTPQNRLLLRFFTWHAVRNAARLIAVSEYTKNDVVRVYVREPGDITVVHHGVGEEFRQPAAGRGGTQSPAGGGAWVPARQQDDNVRRKYGLPEPYVLFVGAFQPRKNIEGLVRAYEQLVTILSTRSTLPHLVLAGGGGWKEAGILRRIAASPVRDRILLLRNVSREDLPALYRGAAVFVLPSFSEGFGMPVLEAMAAGTPVVASNTSSLPEVAGDAALLADPRDPKAIAHALARSLDDTAPREALIRKGRERAARFTWDRTAEETAEVIEHAGAEILRRPKATSG